MTDYHAARKHMVDSQVLPNSVHEPKLVAALGAIPKEIFVPERLQPVAYLDEDLEVSPGRFLLAPMVLARLLQGAEIKSSDVVLDIGCTTGYSTAILAQIADVVVGQEETAALADAASDNLSALEIDNAAIVTGPLAQGCAEQGPFDVIVVGGGVEHIDDRLIDQLADRGRLVAIFFEGGVGHAILLTRNGDHLGRRILFDAGAPLLPGFSKAPEFIF